MSMARVLNGARYFFPDRKNMAVPEGFEPSIRLFNRITV
jgi:hypothetical protein